MSAAAVQPLNIAGVFGLNDGERLNRRMPAMTWTRITDPELVAARLPAWFASRMVGLRGWFGCC